MKKLIAAAAALMMTLTLATGCGAKPTQAKLIVGLDDQFPPMGFRDEKNNLVGFDVDMATEVGKRLGMEVVLTPIDWSTKELELANGKVNVIWNGLTITQARKDSMLMSPAYLKNAQVVMVSASSPIKAVADLAGKKVAMQEGSSAQEAFSKCPVSGKEAELITAPENITLFQDLGIGRIDAVVVDKVVADYYISQNPDSKLTVLAEELEAEEYGFAFKKGDDDFANKIMGEVQKMTDDGTAATISKKWFGEDRNIFKYSK